MGTRPKSITGIVLAIIAGLVMLASGIDIWLALGVMLIWIASYWLPVSEPPAAPKEEPEEVNLTRSGMQELMEHSGLPVLMVDRNRIISANAAAREAVGSHIVGQDSRVAFRHPTAVELLSRSEGGSAHIQGLTGPRSNWQMTYQPIDERYYLIELVNRTSEADISRAHTDFVANASHELRTPLAAIIGYMETLEDEGDKVDPKNAQRFYGIVLREARRLQALVDDLMSLSRVEAEKHDQPREQVDLALLTSQAARDGAGPDRLDRLDLHVPQERFTIRGDHRQLEQLVRNLVDNAMKYGRPDTPVTVRLEAGQRQMAVLSVTDEGEGIAPEHVPHLTRRFYRTDPGRSRAAGGTGLGLAIVKHIVERHRGKLDISSKLGVGTRVAVRIPLVPTD